MATEEAQRVTEKEYKGIGKSLVAGVIPTKAGIQNMSIQVQDNTEAAIVASVVGLGPVAE